MSLGIKEICFEGVEKDDDDDEEDDDEEDDDKENDGEDGDDEDDESDRASTGEILFRSNSTSILSLEITFEARIGLKQS